jgi:hypothetical protein
VLVSHHPELPLTGVDLATDRLDEVDAAAAAEPGAANDEVPPGGARRLLAAQLAAAVRADRVDPVLLAVGASARAVEDVVGGDLEQERVDPVARLGEVGDRGAVDPGGELLLGLAAVDRGEGGTVDDRRRA